MLLSPDEQTIVSSLGWVDRGAIWVLDVATGRVRSVQMGDAKYLSLQAGRAGHFAAIHHYDADRLVITAHSFSCPEDVLGRCVISHSDRRIEGSPMPWENLPRHYVAYLVQPAWSDFALVTVDASRPVSLQTFEWYDDSYDKGYQGIVGVTDVPGSNLLLVSVQRSSKLVIYDPDARRKQGEVALAGNHGNPSLHFRRASPELWADDYDTLLKLEPGSWRILRSRKLQGAAQGTAQFIGQFTFNDDESICAVARPYSGDVLGLNPRTLRTSHRAKLGKQPLEVALLRDGTVCARDWKSGDLLRGKLRRAWFA
jgi:hypothetical protein